MQAKVICSKFQGISSLIGEGKSDVVYANPPYSKNTLTSSDNPVIAISTHEIEMNLSELILEVKRLLKFGGRFYVIYPADRLADLLFELKLNKLEPKTLTMIHPKMGKNAELVLLSASKGGKSGLVVSKPLYQKDENGNDSPEMRAIYSSKD